MPGISLRERWNERALEEALATRTVNTRDADGVTPLWHAVYFGKASWVARLLDAGATLDGHDAARVDRGAPVVTVWRGNPKPGYTAAPTGTGTLLHVAAARAGSPEVARVLMQRGVAVDARDAYGCTPLHIAAFHGHAPLALLLIEHGAAVNAVDRAGYTPLDHGWSKHAVLRALLDRGADPNGGPRVPWPTPTSHAWSVVTHAAQAGQVDVLSALIKAGADLARHREALPLAALHGRADAVRLLLKHGAPIDATTRHAGLECGPLAASAAAASLACAEILLPQCEREVNDALVAAITSSGDRSPARGVLVTSLLAQGANASGALIAATVCPDPSYVEVLLAHGARADVSDATGEGALVHAARLGRAAAVRALLLHGANANARAADGRSAYAVAEESYRKRGIDEARLVMRALDDAGGGPVPSEPENDEPPVGPTVGLTVAHAKFGEGEVLAIDGDKLTVAFEGGERKTVLAKFVTVKR